MSPDVMGAHDIRLPATKRPRAASVPGRPCNSREWSAIESRIPTTRSPLLERPVYLSGDCSLHHHHRGPGLCSHRRPRDATAPPVAAPTTLQRVFVHERHSPPAAGAAIDFTTMRDIPMKKTITLAEEVQPKIAERADLLPVEGFSLIVDGHFKTRFDNEKAAQEAGAELLGRFPRLQVLIYDAATKTRSPLP